MEVRWSAYATESRLNIDHLLAESLYDSNVHKDPCLYLEDVCVCVGGLRLVVRKSLCRDVTK